MRPREEIMGDMCDWNDCNADTPGVRGMYSNTCALVEVLLDIRDLLQQDNRPAVTYPESAPPPEVNL